ncbi:MAG: hypothetical protein Q7R47_04390 [Candidatus Diapherotrites archaeon]|nr:hypothetical protein [Candidatus Diapherotrites archaeon]
MIVHEKFVRGNAPPGTEFHGSHAYIPVPLPKPKGRDRDYKRYKGKEAILEAKRRAMFGKK